ncbi:MAG: sigma-E processing peptidase SpoIIGA, partial [Lachnospiraceae bacterium]|nr:sigma-E processing peptidase SpoIIGA [Lachnospiraceae bacterium]
ALLPLPFMAAVCLAFVLSCMGLRYLYRRGRQTDNSAVVKLTCEGKSLTLAGLLDTGNQLAEPITGRPVSIADEETLKPLLGPEWEKRQGFCLIPFHSLGTGKGWLRGVTLDEMSVTMRRGSREVRRPVIALYDGKVSAGKEYQVILHPEHAP